MNSISGIFNRLVVQSDRRVVLFLLIFGLLLNVPGLGKLEFFRHTEADRTLIAWEMLERGDFVVPHLLGSPILTKPPLYYWILAGVMKLTGQVDEFVLRLPSAVAATLLAVIFFLTARQIEISRSRALMMATVLLTSFLYLTLAVAAEIDMVFCLLSTSSLLALFVATEKRSFAGVAASWFLCALAFLTKGPPVVAFFAVGILILTLQRRAEEDIIAWSFKAHLFGVLFFVGPVIYWLTQVLAAQGSEQLLESFRTEIVERVVSKQRNEKPFYYYIPNLFFGFLPWSLIAAVGFCARIVAVRSRSSARVIAGSSWAQHHGERRFFWFCTILACILLFMFSLARGKTPRYLFPAYPFFVPLFWLGCYLSVKVFLLERASRFLKVFGVVFAVCGVGLMFVPLDGVTIVSRLLSILVGWLFVVMLISSARSQSVVGLSVAVLLLVVTMRVGENSIYAQYRNATRSVKPQVEAIEKLVPISQPIFTIEMFERWVVYYLKRDGYRIQRLTDPVIEGPLPERVYLLLSSDDEGWRLEQLRRFDPTAVLRGEFESGTTRTYLLEVSSGVLGHVHPRRFIPTVPSEPYYVDRLEVGVVADGVS